MSLETAVRDRALLESLSHGNRDAFWVLWKRHEPHLLAVCIRQMKRIREDAEDAVSRSMLLAHAKLPVYAREIVDLEAWLTRLTCNVCLDMKKERCRGSRRAEPLDDTVLTRREASLPEPRSPEDTYASLQVLDTISRAISMLPPLLRDAAVLRFVHEEGYPEIARRLRITEPNARKRVQHARMNLMAKLLPAMESLGARRN